MVEICMDCNRWTFIFETNSMIMGFCLKQKREVNGILMPKLNDCPLIKKEDYEKIK
ncbi:MAG: hypothetical protein ACFFG0_08095 [Candidatus Thorarchaeota archaeon]